MKRLRYSLHPEVLGRQPGIVDLQDELGVSDAGGNDLARESDLQLEP